ncbi:chemotaxis-specific protein-glutamate methyltransferase CheB [Polyangium fumosum]|uniref:Protein-glutamate methylesterase/protein-glutamine glutaminase n=1 Tax=Polyangium fumosum TaxID=889272 RepID=A0A4U1JIJ9_9BACT|nr:chemotaxis-specific protein-glutamate methyltransferase CheB [Polyangium fumosum]
MKTGPLRVLVVDDSAYNRRNIADILSGSDEVEVVGKAGDGEEALRLALSLKPDVITLDLEMPKMDGFTFLRILMVRQPTPVIVVSSYSQKENVFKALELGAVDFVAKPSQRLAPDTSLRREILQKVLLVRYLRPLAAVSQRNSAIPPLPRSTATPQVLSTPQPEQPSARSAANIAARFIVGIGSSTGGPTALLEILSRVPEKFAGAILIAQHMPEKFTRTFAERLDRKSAIRVSEAVDGDIVTARRAFICPGKMCMEAVVSQGPSGMGWNEIRLRVGPPSQHDRYIPSADRLLRSLAPVGSRAYGVILTGMGDDGVAGARAIRAGGGTIIAESEETAVVYGMPRAAVKAGVVNEVMGLPQIVDWVAQLS